MKSVFKTLDRNRPRKMVFYGRVSTEHEAQLAALKNQMQWYDDQERYHPNWTVVDRYIDAPDIIGLKQNPTKRASLQSYFFVYRAFFGLIRQNATLTAKEENCIQSKKGVR